MFLENTGMSGMYIVVDVSEGKRRDAGFLEILVS